MYFFVRLFLLVLTDRWKGNLNENDSSIIWKNFVTKCIFFKKLTVFGKIDDSIIWYRLDK
jgi:hypothetical protein